MIQIQAKDIPHRYRNKYLQNSSGILNISGSSQSWLNKSHDHLNKGVLDLLTVDDINWLSIIRPLISLDVDGNLRIDKNVYSTGGLSGYGTSPSSGGGGGIIQTVYGYNDLGGSFLDTDLTNT